MVALACCRCVVRSRTGLRVRTSQTARQEVTLMGSRRLRPMTAADLPTLPSSCARCTFWETSLSDLAASPDHVDRPEMKAEWAEIVTRHWGYCGVMAFADDEPIGHLTLAP